MGIFVVAHGKSGDRRKTRCSRCNQAGHNVRKCPEPEEDSEQPTDDGDSGLVIDED